MLWGCPEDGKNRSEKWTKCIVYVYEILKEKQLKMYPYD